MDWLKGLFNINIDTLDIDNKQQSNDLRNAPQLKVLRHVENLPITYEWPMERYYYTVIVGAVGKSSLAAADTWSEIYPDISNTSEYFETPRASAGGPNECACLLQNVQLPLILTWPQGIIFRVIDGVASGEIYVLYYRVKIPQ